MDKQTIENNKQRFIELSRTHIHRDGLECLLNYIESSDFYVAPSSTNFHLNVEGGLCQHSLNVFDTLISIYDTTVKPRIISGNAAFTEEISMESMAIVALFHDLCKVNLYHQTERWYKDEQNRWQSYPGYEIKDNFPFGHGEKSCLMINWYLKLKQEELLAIRWHMGMFEMTEQGSSSRFAYRTAMEKSPLVSLLHTADMIAANCFEVTTKHP